MTTTSHQQTLEAAIAAAQAGNDARARELLLPLVETDEANVAAWWWLGQVSDDAGDKEICFGNVLALEPDNEAAQEALESVRRGREIASYIAETTYSPVSPPPPPPIPTTAATEIDQLPEDVAPTAPHIAEWAMFDDPLQCPYCAAPTDEDDHVCPVCENPLWAYRAPLEQKWGPYWASIAVEVAQALGALPLAMLLLVYVGMQFNVDGIGQILPIYLGTSPARQEIIDLAFTLVPPSLFWMTLIPVALLPLMLVCLLPRWEPLYFGALTLAGIRLIVGASVLLLIVTGSLGSLPPDIVEALELLVPKTFLRIIYRGIIMGNVIFFLLEGVALWRILTISDYFTFEVRRLYLTLDEGVEDSEIGLWISGRKYAEAHMWAKAALHLRYALAREKRVEVYLMLALAYINIGFLDQATTVLDDLRQHHPDHPQLAEMDALLAQARAASR